MIQIDPFGRAEFFLTNSLAECLCSVLLSSQQVFALGRRASTTSLSYETRNHCLSWLLAMLFPLLVTLPNESHQADDPPAASLHLLGLCWAIVMPCLDSP